MDGVYETLFILKMHGNWNFFEAFALPISLRNWFARKLANHLKEINEARTKK
tara:strand:+ start:857 stop:1012 length:156 start_codon:yes stop_codon:yes gene_type:complete